MRYPWSSWMRAAGLKYAGPSPGPIFEDFNLLRWPARALHLAVWSSSSTSRVNNDLVYYLIEPEDAQHRHAAAIATFKDWLLKQATA